MLPVAVCVCEILTGRYAYCSPVCVKSSLVGMLTVAVCVKSSLGGMLTVVVYV